MRVTLIAQTAFETWPEDIPWHPDTSMGERGWWSGEQLAEFAGRACYQSWGKPNPKTATNEGYLAHILEIGHESVLEHGSASFYIEGVSRSLTHELIRHRHLSYSQLSQRYVDEGDAEFVPPPAIKDDPELLDLFDGYMADALHAYEVLLDEIEEHYDDLPVGTGKRKQIRQAARAVLPNATETKIVVTGNYRAWRHFVTLRGTEHADVEIRALAVELFKQLRKVAPNVFQDLVLVDLPDGTTGVERDG